MLAPHNESGEKKFRSTRYLDNSDSAAFIFLGSSMVFSNRLLRALKFEFSDALVLRKRDVSDLDTLDDRIKLAAKLIIFDEAAMETLLRSKRELDPIYGDVDKVLAYSSPKVAKELRNHAMRSDKEVGIRYLPMKASFDAWLAALRLLLLGEEFVPAELLDSLVKPSATSDLPCASISDAQQETPDPVRLVPNLTVRETEVLKLVSTGLPNKTIAEKLRLSEHTVKLHVHHIFGKLRVHNRASATNWYLSHRDNRDQLDGR